MCLMNILVKNGKRWVNVVKNLALGVNLMKLR
jgi:hypothetical protein